MSLYYALVFGILMFESGLILLLGTPISSVITKIIILPFNKNNNLITIIKCIIAFILLLFIDSINKLYHLNYQYNDNIHNSYNKLEYLNLLFLSQRNFYLTGFTLFLNFVLIRVISLINELNDLRGAAIKDDAKDSVKI